MVTCSYSLGMKFSLDKFIRLLLYARLRPIRVFCFHQVSEKYDPTKGFECDWTEINQFKCTINTLKKEYKFISLKEAYTHIKKDYVRIKKYAVLTSDDGYRSLKDILPWLEEQSIPITLFINTGYLDGQDCLDELFAQAKEIKSDLDKTTFVKNLYLTREDLLELQSGFVSYGSHGVKHISARKMLLPIFKEQLVASISVLSSFESFIPFYAYTYGQHSSLTDELLLANGLIPVLIDGKKNVCDSSCIHRECIDKWAL